MRQGNLTFAESPPSGRKPEKKPAGNIYRISEKLHRFHNEVRQLALDERSMTLKGIDVDSLTETDGELWERWKRGNLSMEEIEAHRRILADTRDIEEAKLIHSYIKAGVIPDGLTENQMKLYKNLKAGNVSLEDIKKRAKAREEMKGHVFASVQLLEFFEIRIKRDRHL